MMKLDEVKEILRAHEFAPVQFNDSLSRQLPDKLFLVSSKNDCDCGSVISSARKGENPVTHQDERQRLKRKGLSETKILRAVVGKFKAASLKPDKLAEDRNRWFNLIHSLLAIDRLKFVGILAHEYSGSISEETITVAGPYYFKIGSFQRQQLDEFELDVFYEIRTK